MPMFLSRTKMNGGWGLGGESRLKFSWHERAWPCKNKREGKKRKIQKDIYLV